MVPKGTLVVIGDVKPINTEDKEFISADFPSHEIFGFLAQKKCDRMEIVVSGSSTGSLSEKWCKILSEMGFSNFDFLHVGRNEMPDQNSLLTRLSQARTVFFLGDQAETYDIFKKSGVLRFLYRKYLFENNFTIAGMSVGAMCIPGLMISEGKNDLSTDLVPGLGFLNNCIIDAQFIYKTRFKRLAYTVVQNRDFLGLGLGENTALIIRKGCLATCKGSGTVMVINAKNVKQINADLAGKGSSVYVKNMKGHILINGCTINLNNGEVA